MLTLTAPQGYKSGGVWGVCDRCAYKRRLAELRKEWTGFKVCAECFDPQPADLSPPRIYPEGLPVRDARPEPPALAPAPKGGLDLADTEDGGLLYWWGIT